MERSDSYISVLLITLAAVLVSRIIGEFSEDLAPLAMLYPQLLAPRKEPLDYLLTLLVTAVSVASYALLKLVSDDLAPAALLYPQLLAEQKRAIAKIRLASWIHWAAGVAQQLVVEFKAPISLASLLFRKLGTLTALTLNWLIFFSSQFAGDIREVADGVIESTMRVLTVLTLTSSRVLSSRPSRVAFACVSGLLIVFVFSTGALAFVYNVDPVDLVMGNKIQVMGQVSENTGRAVLVNPVVLLFEDEFVAEIAPSTGASEPQNEIGRDACYREIDRMLILASGGGYVGAGLIVDSSIGEFRRISARSDELRSVFARLESMTNGTTQYASDAERADDLSRVCYDFSVLPDLLEPFLDSACGTRSPELIKEMLRNRADYYISSLKFLKWQSGAELGVPLSLLLKWQNRIERSWPHRSMAEGRNPQYLPTVGPSQLRPPVCL